VIALPCLLYSMDSSVLYLALPSLTADLKPSSTQLLWITDIYGFMIAGLLITMGTVGDRIGRRRLMPYGAAAFGAASVLAAFASSTAMLIVARALMGIAAATLAPSTLSLIRNMFADPRQRTVAIGVWVTSFSAGAAAGPLLGGVLLHFFWWGSVFLIAVPVMALLLVLGPVLLPEFRNPALAAWTSPAPLVAGLCAGPGVRHQGAGPGRLRPGSVLSFLAGLVIGLAFLRRQATLAVPLVDLRLFRARAFAASLAANTLSLFLIFGNFFLIAQYLQLVLGLSPLAAGVWTAPSSIGFIACTQLAPQVVRRLGAPVTMASALALATAGLAILARLPGSGGPGLTLVAGSVLLALGVSPVVTLATDLIVGAAPPERAGEASGLPETGTLPAGARPHALTAARGTLAAAMRAADRLPPQFGAPLRAAARAAFTHGLHVAAIAAAALAITLVITAATMLRRPRPDPRPKPAPQRRRAASGSGRLTVGGGRWTSDYSFNSRFHGVLDGAVANGGATNPEELLAAAHAACFSMPPPSCAACYRALWCLPGRDFHPQACLQDTTCAESRRPPRGEPAASHSTSPMNPWTRNGITFRPIGAS
jgi:DHA2 family multidrug resistance protein-like MFS transporter